MSSLCIMKRFFVLLFVILVLLSSHHNFVSGQRFMRQGFSGQEDFSSEVKLDPNEVSDAAYGMTREMFLIHDLTFTLPPIQFNNNIWNNNNNNIIRKEKGDNTPTSIEDLDRKVQKHINQYIGGYQHRNPITMQLYNKRGKYGLRAIGSTTNGKKLRAFWRQATTIIPSSSSSTSTNNNNQSRFLTLSYDDALKTRLFTIEFEIQLPPIDIDNNNNYNRKNNNKVLPSVIYQIPIESGNMNPKSMIPRGVANVLLYPYGRQPLKSRSTTTTTSSESISKYEPPIPIGTCRIGIGIPSIRPGLIDPSWSKGKNIFRCGRSAGMM